MSGEGGMTLAFELDALYRLADPEVAVRESETWAASVGIVSDTMPDQIPRSPIKSTSFLRSWGA